MAISKIQNGDKVKVITGKYRGTLGVVTKVTTNLNRRGVIQKRVSLNTLPKMTKYRKAYALQGENYPGAKLTTDRFIDISNVSLVTEDGQLSKIKIDQIDGKKIRIYKKNGTAVVKEKLLEEASENTKKSSTTKK